MKKQTQIFSIFGQIESVVAQAMIDEGVIKKIDANLIPPTVKYDDQGNIAKFAIVIDHNMINVFNKRVMDLRA